jgi:hypothetical protein
MTTPSSSYARECAAAAHAFVRCVQTNEADGDEKLADYLDKNERPLWDSLLIYVDLFGKHELTVATENEAKPRG